MLVVRIKSVRKRWHFVYQNNFNLPIRNKFCCDKYYKQGLNLLTIYLDQLFLGLAVLNIN